MKTIRYRPGRLAGLLTAAAALAACDDSGTGVPGPGTVALSFSVSGGAAPAAMAPAAVSGADLARVAGPPLSLSGSNGTLTIDEIRLIVAEVELDGEDDACEMAGGSDDCADFDGGPRFLDLPLDGSPVDAFTSQVPPGVYDELEFEIEDLEDDEENPTLRAQIEALEADIRAEFPDWPRKATALVAGSFDDGSGGSISFRVFLEAEIEIERDLVPPIVVDDSGDTGSALMVELDVGSWFLRSDGTVLPLHIYDYDQTGQLLEFEVEMENGFTEIEIER